MKCYAKKHFFPQPWVANKKQTTTDWARLKLCYHVTDRSKTQTHRGSSVSVSSSSSAPPVKPKHPLHYPGASSCYCWEGPSPRQPAPSRPSCLVLPRRKEGKKKKKGVWEGTWWRKPRLNFSRFNEDPADKLGQVLIPTIGWPGMGLEWELYLKAQRHRDSPLCWKHMSEFSKRRNRNTSKDAALAPGVMSVNYCAVPGVSRRNGRRWIIVKNAAERLCLCLPCNPMPGSGTATIEEKYLSPSNPRGRLQSFQQNRTEKRGARCFCFSCENSFDALFLLLKKPDVLSGEIHQSCKKKKKKSPASVRLVETSPPAV